MLNLQFHKFETPRAFAQDADRYGCVKFYSYGFIQTPDQEIHHIKNPDFDWGKAWTWKP